MAGGDGGGGDGDGDGDDGDGDGGGGGGGGAGGLRGGAACVGAPLIRDRRTSSPLMLLGYDSINQNCSAISVTCMNMCC